jgi:hypothetical protein
MRMKERDLNGSAPQNNSLGEWDTEVLSQALHSQPRDQRDVAFGDGTALDVGKEQQTTLEIYPNSAVARVLMRHCRLELYRQAAPAIQPNGILFEQHSEDQSLTLSLTPDGAVRMAVSSSTHDASSGTNKEPPAPSTTMNHAEVSPAISDAVVAHFGAAGMPSSEQSGSPQLAEQQEERRVSLTGRVGATPAFRTTPKGVFIGRFPLAVRDEEDQTHWHSILAFNDRARKLQEAKLAKGQLVGVTGYVHEREQLSRGGSFGGWWRAIQSSHGSR